MSAATRQSAALPAAPRLEWIEPVKALAILGILLNHLVETFGPSAWFTNPGQKWPDLSWRLSHVFPQMDSLPAALVTFVGWLGDSGPGVFILLSGFGLTWAVLWRGGALDWRSFYGSRAARILPLYLAIHWITLGLAVLFANYSFEDGRVFFSLLGLRASSELFFFINPSWWFIWIVIQLYLVFPLLMQLLQRRGTAALLGLSLAVTVVSRWYGIEFAEHRYDWLTGMFFGSRLAEFAMGMALAAWLYRRREIDSNVAPVLRLSTISLLVFASGLAADLFLPSVLVSNLLVSCGLTGLLYCMWRGVKAGSVAAARGLAWVGVTSYGVFLLHQAPMTWVAGALSDHSTFIAVLGAVAVVVLSFPVARLIERILAAWEAHAGNLLRLAPIRGLLASAASVVLVSLIVLEGQVSGSWKRQVFAFILGSGILTAAALEWRARDQLGFGALRWLLWSASIGAALQLFVLEPGSGLASAIAGVLIAGVAILMLARGASARISVATAATACAFAVAVSEIVLRQAAPLETARWGEYPVLTADPQRIYALKPSIDLNLRYNNYDYRVRTNSAGLAMGEIAPARPKPDTLRILALGDAFTMPEGVDYERSWPYLLEKRLRSCVASHSVEVINGGVTGYSPTEKLPQFRRLVDRYRPDIVLDEFFPVELSWMDWPAERRLQGIGLMPDRSSLLQGLQARSQTLKRIARLQQDLGWRVFGEVPAWRADRALLSYHERGDLAVYGAQRREQLRVYFRTLSGESRTHGMQVMAIYVPTALSVLPVQSLRYLPAHFEAGSYDLDRPRREFAATMNGAQVPWLDLSPEMKAGAQLQPYFPDSWHWTATGHRIAADAIAAALAQRGLLAASCRDERLAASLQP